MLRASHLDLKCMSMGCRRKLLHHNFKCEFQSLAFQKDGKQKTHILDRGVGFEV